MNKQQKLVQKKFLNDEQEVIKRLEKVYKDSLTEVESKIKNLTFKIGDLEQEYEWLDSNDPAKAKVKSMIQSKIYQKQYQEQLQMQISGILSNMQTKSYLTVSDYLDECYTNGFIGTMFDAHGQGVPIIAPINQEAMIQAVQYDSKISKGLYTKLGYDVGDLKKRITAQVSRSISTGQTYADTARQLQNQTRIGYNKAIRIARTEGHRVQTTAAMDAMETAKDKGADVVKQWDATLDGRTRPSHRRVDGEIRELNEKFSNGMMYPGSDGKASEVINCRCALLQRARWALDDDELKTLKERAAAHGLDKTEQFDDFKSKYLQAVNNPEPEPVYNKKKEYLTKKKLEEKIAEIEKQQQLLPDGDEKDQLEILKADYQEKLDKKIVTAETKKLKKEQIALQDDFDKINVKTYSGIWKDDVTTADYAAKKSGIQGKRDYFTNKINNTTDPVEIQKWEGLLKAVEEFEIEGEKYYIAKAKLDKVSADLKKLQTSGINQAVDDAFTAERKNAAYWFTDKTGSTRAADGVLRDKSGEVWRTAIPHEQDSIYEYTRSYSKFNEPLRGIEYGTNKFLGVGNVDLDKIGVSYAGFRPGEVKSQIDAMTSIIDKSSYDFDIWVQRGCRRTGMDKFFGISLSDFDLPEDQLAAKLIGTTPIEYAFMSTGVAKGKGLNTSGGILLNIYAPSGTKMMYAEPFSAYGRGAGRSWDGISKQNYFGDESEMLIQRGTKFRVTKVEKSNGTIYVDLEIIEQGVK